MVTQLADPGVEIPEVAAAAHGVTIERTHVEDRSMTEVLAEVGEYPVVAMVAGTPVVAFNVSYDLTLMKVELACHGLSTVRSYPDRELGPVANSLILDRAVDRYRCGKRCLGGPYEVYGMCVDKAPHVVEVDVVATFDTLGALTAAHPQFSELDPDEPVAFRARAHHTWAESFNE